MSTNKEPAPVAILAARVMRAYPTLSAYSAASLATELCAIERAQRRHAERCCNGEDGGYVRRPNVINAGYYGVVEHDPVAEERAGKRIVSALTRWKSEVSHRVLPDGIGAPDGDPRHESMIRIASDLSTRIDLEGDPRGPVLLVRFPGEVEASGV